MPKASGKSVRHHLRDQFRRRLGVDSPEAQFMKDLEQEIEYMEATPGQRRACRYALLTAVREHYQSS